MISGLCTRSSTSWLFMGRVFRKWPMLGGPGVESEGHLSDTCSDQKEELVVPTKTACRSLKVNLSVQRELRQLLSSRLVGD